MKVKIARHKKWIGPYQIAECLKYFGVSSESREKVADWLDGTDDNPSKLSVFLNWLYEWRNRNRVKVVIHDHDIWGLDTTLNPIILALLKKFHTDEKFGVPFVDDADVPEDIRRSNCPPVKQYDVDEFHPARWNWVLDEMVWAFSELNSDCENEPNPGTLSFKEYHDRIRNGTILFGKYYQSLWT